MRLSSDPLSLLGGGGGGGSTQMTLQHGEIAKLMSGFVRTDRKVGVTVTNFFLPAAALD